MQSEIEKHNKSLISLKYRLGDSIRHSNIDLSNARESIAYKYHKHSDKNKKKSETHFINYELLYNIVMDSEYNECPKNSIVFNLRLHEWFDWGNSKVVSVDSNYKFIEKYNEMLTNLD